jgi:hypothetical protein
MLVIYLSKFAFNFQFEVVSQNGVNFYMIPNVEIGEACELRVRETGERSKEIGGEAAQALHETASHKKKSFLHSCRSSAAICCVRVSIRLLPVCACRLRRRGGKL